MFKHVKRTGNFHNSKVHENETFCSPGLTLCDKKSNIQQTCHSDLTQNLKECENKSGYIEKNLNLTIIKIALLYIEISTKFIAKKSEL